MKTFTELSIPGVFEIEMFHAGDDRGMFVKPYHKDTLEKHGLVSEFRESFYSTNKKGVIRGMHFQYPPHDHAKIVYCTSGKLIDVILDLRIGSPTYGKSVQIELSADNFKAAYLPIGVAHGFAVLEDNTCMVYLTSTVHAPSSDGGIHFASFECIWPFESPITSERDLEFQTLKEFESPFIYA
ncbi:dTDP-4-dehydrorhamnose 3,5-epimerase family protein [Salibacteraceae bacterium]|jgi:dTDP-4-dehydrorhamnose 3,5-epimerase|nr:dTDP-4-dehydrorhamnose 3,5-epimerase family protein [Salibacteraceae bacterium]MDA9267271.1 dTDP-4-dehydrorhamnose 3,5-epimerase family protein [Salibacteraceae bacterium]MDB9708771.1 dTDP-4-dehydrorhamnose 3,5-epimerase family protein [Salibacteraceae bacterium]MDC1305115.1 dTDP-4-dehydrorhamnose 3,5-epimerase family protein [Salibacteraceae bacterium]